MQVRLQERAAHGDFASHSATDFWLPTSTGTVSAKWYWPTAVPSAEAIGVLILPSLLHEEQTTAIGLSAFAEDLANHAMPSLLVDLAGTAQGTPAPDAAPAGERWADTVHAAIRHMRDCGLRHIAVVGVRVGGLIAIDALADDPVDLLVLWSPILSGRRYIRELQLMQASAKERDDGSLPGITVAGFNLPPEAVTHLRGLDAAKITGKPARRLCIVDSEDQLEGLDRNHPLLDAVPFETLDAPETRPWLFTMTDFFPGPFEDMVRVRRQIQRMITVQATTTKSSAGGPAPDAAGNIPKLPDLGEHRSQVVDHLGTTVRETFVEFGTTRGGRPERLSGILTEPIGSSDPSASYVAITTVDHGRVFPDFARNEAAVGRTTLRFDLAGFGSSAKLPGHAPAEFYHRTAPTDIAAAVDELTRRGHRNVHIIGYCAGAWSALQIRHRDAVKGIICINVQLFVRGRLHRVKTWPNQSIGRRMFATAAQRRRVIRAFERMELGHPLPSPPIRAMKRQADRGTAITLIFADDDLGLTYYRQQVNSRFGRRFHRTTNGAAPGADAPVASVRAYTGLGHMPSGVTVPVMLADIHEFTS